VIYAEKERDFGDKLNNLFDISHSNAMDLMKIKEDKDFLQLQQKSGRPGCMTDVDTKLAGVEQRKLIRNEINNEKV